MKSYLRKAAGLSAILAGSALPANGQVVVNYSPDQIGSVSAPVEGLGATSSDYLLTGVGGTAELEKNFTTNGQDSGIFSNPTTAQDAASFDDNYMFQLDTNNNISKVDLSSGAPTAINGSSGITAGANSFGIGYDANSNSIGIGLFDNGTMTFKEYDLGTNTLNTLASFAFDTSAYGTPTGLDFKNNRMIVGTRDGPAADEFLPERNFILDMNANDGSIDQYATIAGSTNKLQDVLYDDGRLATGYDRAGSGLVTVGDFNIVPEPSQYAALAGALALGATALRRRQKK